MDIKLLLLLISDWEGGECITVITAILPAYNEEVSVGSVVLRTLQHADRVIVVDDGSIDHTAEVARLAGAEVIRHPQNRGKGAALRTGFENVDGVGVVVTMDTDGQHNPADIPKLVEPILRGEADMVNGSRYIGGKKTSTPAYRRAGQIVLDKVTNMDCGLAISDTQSGFRAFAAHTVDAFRFQENGLAIESEMLVDAAKAGFRIREIEIGVRYDVNCSKKHPLSHGLEVMARVLHDVEVKRPLFWFTLPGIMTGGIGIGMGLYFIRNFLGGVGLQFGPTIFVSLLMIIGLFMALTGIVLHSIALMINELKAEIKPLWATENVAPSRGPDYYLKKSKPKEVDPRALRIERDEDHNGFGISDKGLGDLKEG